MVRILVAIAVLLSAVQFCAPAVADPGIADGAGVRSLGDRTYRVYKPADLPAAAPLVIVMHGLSGTAVNAEEKFGWNQLADSAKFVVAYPDGVSKSWNTTAGCCGNAGRQNVDDIGFLTGVVRDIGANVPIDPARVYAAGISNGGVMAFALACQTDLFAAVGVVSGTQLGGCNPPNPPSVIQIHGTSDPIIHFDGSPGFGFAGGQPIPRNRRVLARHEPLRGTQRSGRRRADDLDGRLCRRTRRRTGHRRQGRPQLAAVRDVHALGLLRRPPAVVLRSGTPCAVSR